MRFAGNKIVLAFVFAWILTATQGRAANLTVINIHALAEMNRELHTNLSARN